MGYKWNELLPAERDERGSPGLDDRDRDALWLVTVNRDAGTAPVIDFRDGGKGQSKEAVPFYLSWRSAHREKLPPEANPRAARK